MQVINNISAKYEKLYRFFDKKEYAIQFINGHFRFGLLTNYKWIEDEERRNVSENSMLIQDEEQPFIVSHAPFILSCSKVIGACNCFLSESNYHEACIVEFDVMEFVSCLKLIEPQWLEFKVYKTEESCIITNGEEEWKISPSFILDDKAEIKIWPNKVIIEENIYGNNAANDRLDAAAKIWKYLPDNKNSHQEIRFILMIEPAKIQITGIQEEFKPYIYNYLKATYLSSDFQLREARILPYPINFNKKSDRR